MKPKVIKSKADQDQALARIEEIFGAKRGTPEGDELELLTMLVEQFEEKHHPIALPSPLSAIRFRMDQLGLSAADLVAFIGSRSKVSEVMSGKRSLSLNMIRRLAGGLGIPAEVLIGTSGAELPPEAAISHLRRYPFAAMFKRGWFPWFRGSLSEAKDALEEIMSQFVSPLGSDALRPALNRQHVRDGSTCDNFALAAWRIRVTNVAMKEVLPAYQKGTVTLAFLRHLAQLSNQDAGPRLAVEFLNKSGIHFVAERHLPKTHLDGAAMKMPDGSPLVAVTLRFDRLDNFWFTLFHELAHVGLHLDKQNVEVYFDDLVAPGVEQCEREADNLAQEALIPTAKWNESGLRHHAPASAVIELANELKVSPAIIAGRVRHERRKFTIHKDLVGQGKLRCLFEVP